MDFVTYQPEKKTGKALGFSVCRSEYCSELYNYKTNGDPSVLNCPQTDTEDDHPILRREVEGCSAVMEEREVS